MTQENNLPPKVPPAGVQKEKVLAGLTSSNLQRDTYRPYGIYVTTKRIIGIKPSRLQKINPMWVFVIVLSIVLVGTLLLGLGGLLVPLLIGGFFIVRFIIRRFVYKGDDFSKKTLAELEEKKDIEVFKDNIQEIRLQEPKGAFRGLLGGLGGLGGFGRSRRRSNRPIRDLIILSNEHEYKINIFQDAMDKIYEMFGEPESIEELFEPISA